MPAMMPGPVAPIIEYVMPPLSDARPMIQSLPPVGPDALAEPAMIQVAETRPLNPTLVGPRYDSQVQQVDYTEPMQPAQ